jgi:hypothetical protein
MFLYMVCRWHYFKGAQETCAPPHTPHFAEYRDQQPQRMEYHSTAPAAPKMRNIKNPYIFMP